MASLGRVNIIYGDIEKFFSENEKIKKYAAVLGGDDVKGFGKIEEGFIIIGNESKGISEAVLHFASEKISISKKGKAESLNAAVAAGIILFSLTNPVSG
jgi:TrmH family RNA methyltransferase